MKHTKQINPVDPSPTRGIELPDRTDLSKLYGMPIAKQPAMHMDSVSHKADPDIQPEIVNFEINKMVVAVWLTIIVVVTSVIVVWVYQSAEVDLKHPHPTYPLIRLVVAAICVLTWAITSRALLKEFNRAGFRMVPFLFVYFFYLFPALDAVYGSRLYDLLGLIATSVLWAAFNFFAVFYIVWALNRQTVSTFNKISFIALPAVIFILCAVLI